MAVLSPFSDFTKVKWPAIRLFLEVAIDNPAAEDGSTVMAQMLRTIADEIEQGPTHRGGALRDTKGDTVGRWMAKERRGLAQCQRGQWWQKEGEA